jgi:hypothetical protein
VPTSGLHAEKAKSDTSVWYVLECMSTQSQFGHTLFLDGFAAGSVAKKLTRLHFVRTASETAVYDEAWLQRLIMSQPSLLPVDQIEPAFNALVPICIELPVKSGFLDYLFVTPAGDLALVECKLWRNPEAQREVIAQIIAYATEISTWTYKTLQDAIRRTKPLGGSGENTTRSLYELVSAHSEIDEASFHDAVSRNLKRGRFLLLIVGDGIREGVERMAEYLQQHAGFHFTLAFIEIALFEAPGGYIAQPRVLARTKNIERGIVTLDEGRIVIGPSSTGLKPDSNGGRRTTITQERYFEQIEKDFPGVSQTLNAFIDGLATCNVLPEFGTDSMILRWRPEDGRNWNLATISTRGQVFTDNLSSQANNAGLLEIYKQYLKKLADLVPGAVLRKGQADNTWGVAHNGKSLVLTALLADDARKDGWIGAIADFQSAVMKSSSGE